MSSRSNAPELLAAPLHWPAMLFERTTRERAGESSSFTHSIYRGDRYRIATRLTLGPISG